MLAEHGYWKLEAKSLDLLHLVTINRVNGTPILRYYLGDSAPQVIFPDVVVGLVIF